MADFQAHITQAKKNLAILSEINLKINNSWDWQVTCAYYCAVHIMNAHLAKTFNLHYKTHVDVKKALYNSASPCKISLMMFTRPMPFLKTTPAGQDIFAMSKQGKPMTP